MYKNKNGKLHNLWPIAITCKFLFIATTTHNCDLQITYCFESLSPLSLLSSDGVCLQNDCHNASTSVNCRFTTTSKKASQCSRYMSANVSRSSSVIPSWRGVSLVSSSSNSGKPWVTSPKYCWCCCCWFCWGWSDESVVCAAVSDISLDSIFMAGFNLKQVRH